MFRTFLFMKKFFRFLVTSLLSAIIIGLIILIVMYISTMWLLIILLLISWVLFLRAIFKFKKRIEENFKKQNEKFVESGNAITDTLKVAFDNIKKNSNAISKLQSTLAEQNTKIYRIEQRLSRLTGHKEPSKIARVVEEEKREIVVNKKHNVNNNNNKTDENRDK